MGTASVSPKPAQSASPMPNPGEKDSTIPEAMSEGVRSELERLGVERRGVERLGVEKHGVERQGVERQGVERQGVERRGVERQPCEAESAKVYLSGSEAGREPGSNCPRAWSSSKPTTSLRKRWACCLSRTKKGRLVEEGFHSNGALVRGGGQNFSRWLQSSRARGFEFSLGPPPACLAMFGSPRRKPVVCNPTESPDRQTARF
jgi:hypothetical protein